MTFTRILDRLIIILLIIWFAVTNYGTYYHAKENHHHLHQIGCHVGIEDDCQWLTQKEIK